MTASHIRRIPSDRNPRCHWRDSTPVAAQEQKGVSVALGDPDVVIFKECTGGNRQLHTSFILAFLFPDRETQRGVGVRRVSGKGHI